MSLEWVMAGLLLVAALAPLAWRFRMPMSWTAVVLLAGLVVGGGWLWQNRLQARAASRSELSTKTPRQSRPGGYVSSDTCRSCHPDQYASWHHSFHRTMTQYASPSSVRGDFDDTRLAYEGQDYQLQRRGEEFWVKMVDPEWTYGQMLQRQASKQGYGSAPTLAQAPPPRWRRIGLLTGSHQMQAYWICGDRGNKQFSLPFTYLFEASRWVPRNDVFLLSPGKPWIPQVWNINCINCHATAGQPRQDPKTREFDTRTAELGIACEACHGPAEEHVRHNSNPPQRYSLRLGHTGDPTIFNPTRANHVKSSETCGQCHAIRHKPPSDQWNSEGYTFRPGGDLESVAPLVHYDGQDLHQPGQEKKTALMEGSFWSDGQVRVSGRDFNGMAASACFQRGELTCLSCHSMHRYVNQEFQIASHHDSNLACLQCHSSFGARLEQHTHHAAGSSGSLCYNCHMPRTSYGLLKAIRSHRIASPTALESVKTGRPNACNLCHLDQPLAWTAKKLNEWYGQPAPALRPEEESTAAAVVWLLSGDAGQRSLIAWHMGWMPAKQASGADWLAPYLAELLQDPYSVVRFIAQRSLKRLVGFENFSSDYIGLPEGRAADSKRAWEVWRSQAPVSTNARPFILFKTGGELNQEKVSALLKNRNQRSLELLE